MNERAADADVLELPRKEVVPRLAEHVGIRGDAEKIDGNLVAKPLRGGGEVGPRVGPVETREDAVEGERHLDPLLLQIRSQPAAGLVPELVEPRVLLEDVDDVRLRRGHGTHSLIWFEGPVPRKPYKKRSRVGGMA